MSTEENVDTLVEAPTEEEFNMAISNNMTRMIVVVSRDTQPESELHILITRADESCS